MQCGLLIQYFINILLVQDQRIVIDNGARKAMRKRTKDYKKALFCKDK